MQESSADPVADHAVQLVERYFAVLSDPGSSSSDLDELLHAEMRFVEHPNALSPRGGDRDRAAVLASFEHGRRLLAAQTIETHDLLAAGDVVVARATWTGTLAERFGAVPAGSELCTHFAAFFTIRDGRIWRQENYDCYEPLPSRG